MSAPSSVDLSPAAPLSSVTSTERILTLDALRGLALLGVVVANVWLWFSGLFLRFPGYRDELRGVSLDAIVFFAIAILVSGKAISTFSFLFGHGFAIQMMRAEARGRSNGYGAGLIGRAGPALGLVIAVLVFAAQMMVSAVWLRHYRFGPMEWLWRSLTYGRMQPMRRQVAPERAVVALP